MPTAAGFRELVSGRKRGIVASIARGTLGAVAVPYAAAVRYRNWRYDTSRTRVYRVDVPVISVGNLTLGGTGKTPLVEYLARRLIERGCRPAIVSRGYGAAAGKPNDEALELAARLPDVPHVQNRDRVLAAREAIELFGAQAIIADDAFQHRRLARELEIVVLDATCPFGFGRIFPRGLLREPVEGLTRADAIVLSRADLVSTAERKRIESEARRIAANAAWVESSHAPVGLIDTLGCSHRLETLKGKKVAAFCGIGNPAAFRQTLATCGCEVVAFREFPDHHRYTRSGTEPRSDEDCLSDWAAASDAETVLTTHKDLVKIPVESLGGLPLRAVAIGLSVVAGEEKLIGFLEERVLNR